MGTQSERSFNVVLLGKTGNGKSSTGNTILHRKAFQVSSDKASCTKQSVLEVGDVNGVRIRVVDTPGVKDTDLTNEVTVLNVCSAMSLCPEGFDALVLVLDYNSLHSKEELETLDILNKVFGGNFVRNHCIVVLTHGDNFDLDQSEEEKSGDFSKWCKELVSPREVVKLFQECRYKVVLFYNKGLKFETQRKASVEEFMRLLQNQTGRYTNEHFTQCALERDQFIHDQVRPELRNDIQERLSLLMNDVDDLLSSGPSDKCSDISSLRNRVDELSSHLDQQSETIGSLADLKAKVNAIKKRVQNIEAAHRDREELVLLRQEILALKTPRVNWDTLIRRFLLIVSSILKAAGVVMQVKPELSNLGAALQTAGDLTQAASKSSSEMNYEN